MKELSLREIQMGEYAVLKRLTAICEAQNFRYYLFYGTLLGAVRHKGFIPWDDDVDIIMPRPDYRKLIAYLMAHEAELAPLKLMCTENTPGYIYPIARLCDTRYFVDYQGAAEYGLGLFVDIYPFDGYGNTKEEAEAHYHSYEKLIRFIGVAGCDKFEKSVRGAWQTPFKLAAFWYGRLRGAKYFIRKLESRTAQLPYDECDYVGCSVWDNNIRWIFRREWFGEATRVSFEDGVYSAPSNCDAALTQCYGDYMQLPPVEEQIGHHYYTAYLKDET